MKRLPPALAAVLAILATLAGRARAGDVIWPANQNANGFVVKNQGAPTTDGNSLRLGDMPGSGLPCALAYTGTLGSLFRCAIPTDIPGVTGPPGTVAYFNGSGVLSSLTLAPEFALTTGTLSVATGGISTSKLADAAVTTVKLTDAAVTNAKLATMPALTVKANATNATAPPADLACSTAGTFVGTLSGTSLACAAVPWASLSGTTNAVANGNLAQMPASTIKGNATGATANAQDVPATGANLVPVSNVSGWAWQAVPVAATSGVVANWPLGIPRIFAVDGVNGNDANKGWADPATSSAADVAAATQVAGVIAKKTFGGLAGVFPTQGTGHRAAIVIANGSYSDSLLTAINGTTGYANLVARGTGTNGTAGATAFDGSAADLIYVGAQTAPSMNSGGYNPTAGATTTIIPCRINGGGAVTFPAEPGSPDGYRIRFSSTTATTALRNQTGAIVGALGATLTLSHNTALPTAPGTGDVFYIEAPGVTMPGPPAPLGFRLDGGGLTGFISNALIGISITDLIYPQGDMFFGFVTVAGISGGNGVPLSIDSTGHSVGLYVYVDGVSFPRVGGAGRIDGFINFDFGANAIALPGFVLNGSSSPPIAATDAQTFYIGDGAVTYPQVAVGGKQSTSFAGVTIGGAADIGERAMRAISDGTMSALALGNLVGTVGAIDATRAGSHPAVKITGQSLLTFRNVVSGSSGNSDVGLDLTGAYRSSLAFVSIPTVTGTLGDVRLCNGTIITWSQAASGIVDQCGNYLGNTTYAPLTVSTSGTSITGLGTGFVKSTSGALSTDPGTYLADPGANGILVRTGPGTTAARTFTFDATIGITNPDGVAGAPAFSRTAISGDVTIAGGSNVSVLHNIPDLTTMARSVIATEVTGTSTPAAGKLDIHAESSTDTLWVKDSAGRVTTTARPVAGIAHNVLTSMGADGSFTQAQMSYGDIAGSVPAVTSGTGPVTFTGPGAAATSLNLSSTGISGALGLGFLAQGGATTNQALTWNGSAWVPSTLGTAPSGAAGGALGCSYPNPCLATGVIVSSNFAAFPANTLFGNDQGSSATPRTIGIGAGLSFDPVGHLLNVTVAGGSPAAATYWVSSAASAPSNGVQMQLLGPGVIQQSVSGGAAIPSALNVPANSILTGTTAGGAATADTNFQINSSTHAMTVSGSASFQGPTTTIGAWNGIGKYTTGVVGVATAGVDYVHAVTGTPGQIQNNGTTADPQLGLTVTGVPAGLWIFGSASFNVNSFGQLTAVTPGNFYTDVQSDATPVAHESTLNFHAPLHAADNSGSSRTEVTINDFFASGSSHARGIVPDPGSTAGVRRFLNESGAWIVPNGTHRDYFIDIPSLQPADTANRWLTTSAQTTAAAGGVVEYGNTDFVVGNIGYDLDIVSSSGTATTMWCWATRNGVSIGGTTLIFTPGATPPGVYTISPQATGSSSTADSYGMACVYNGNFVTGPFGATIAFTVHENLLP